MNIPIFQVSGQTIYNPSSSSTSSRLSGATWSISYGDGSSSSGIVYTDKVSVGGLSVASQAVEVAQKVSSSFTSESTIDGLLGLAFSSLNTVSPTSQKTFFDNAKSSLTSPVFTADLNYHSRESYYLYLSHPSYVHRLLGEVWGIPNYIGTYSCPHASNTARSHVAGTYNFGFIDTSAYTGSITYTSVSTRQGFWEWTSTGYAVGSGSFTSTSIDGIADTGTTLLYLPAAVVKAYWAQVSGSSSSSSVGGYIFPCSATLPSFTFGVGTARIVIPGTYIDFGPISTGSSTCFGGIQSSAGIGINIFGDVALKAAFVVFDGTSSTAPRLGWASK